MAKQKSPQCECSDLGCKAEHGDKQCNKRGLRRVSRYDYETDGDHFRFCDVCAEDACDSGVFSID
jgi:hypothetical protein